ncbi:MAG TPA: VIT domain-containing protein, partial [Planctomycetota bacterium]|nr:VIT domain-containing protein [Planctomycetota bacterium]
MESRIAEFLAGELEKRSEVEEHLLVCSDCRARFSSAKAGWDAAGEWKAADPSPDAIESVLSNLPTAAPRRKLLRIFQAGTLAASLFISALVGSSQRSGTARETPARPAATSRPVSIGLASVRPSVGLLYVQDENGRPAGELSIRSLDVRVDIQDGVARTEVEEIFENRTDRRLEGTFLFPLPPDASISRLAMEIGGKLMEGEVVERQKARETYEGIVRRMNDPALLEWMPGGLFKCRIFPIEARSDKRIIIAYTQALSAFDGRAAYVYPLAGDSAGEMGIGRFNLEATVRTGGRLLRAESTSHDAASTRVDDRTIRTTFTAGAFRPKADFVLAYETELGSEIQLSAHRPDPAAPGYFAAFITPRPDADEGYRRDRRLFFLIDASGSVTRPELEAARTVVRRMIESLAPADRFRIGSHNDLVDSMEDFVAPDAAGKAAANRFLGAIEPIGAGDPATSLERVLPLVPDDGEVVYVGEGTPTWGEKDPAKIVARLQKVAKDKGVSIRTVAVGSGADRGLLETLAREFNGGAHSICPSDDVRSRADEIARTLGRSAVNDLKVEFKGAVTDAAPARLGSLHFGERLLVTGRYGAGPVKLILTGKVFDRVIRREFTLTLPERESGNVHVKRLWAQRRLADLVAEGEPKKAEAIKLSVEHQVMTPYTSFLVLESEKAYEDFRIERTKKENDQAVQSAPTLGPGGSHYDLACKYYESGDFEKAEAECDKVLKANPGNGAANALKLELQYALGKGRLTSKGLESEDVIVAAHTRHEQVNLEVRKEVESGIRSYNLGKYLEAEDHFRRVLEYAKWLPKGVDLDAQKKQATEMLGRVRSATSPIDGEVLANRIKATIDSNSWDEAKGQACVFQNGLLIVRNTPEVQRKVRKFLDDLRASYGGSSEKRTDPSPPEPAAGDTGVRLDMYNVQDMTYGLQDFPGVNITLEEDGLGSSQTQTGGIAFTVGEGKGHLGNLPPEAFGLNTSVTIAGSGLSPTLSLLTDIPDPGNGEDSGMLGMDLYDGQKSSGYNLNRSNRLPLLRGPAPADLRVDGFYSERSMGASHWVDDPNVPYFDNVLRSNFFFDRRGYSSGRTYLQDIETQMSTA